MIYNPNTPCLLVRGIVRVSGKQYEMRYLEENHVILFDDQGELVQWFDLASGLASSPSEVKSLPKAVDEILRRTESMKRRAAFLVSEFGQDFTVEAQISVEDTPAGTETITKVDMDPGSAKHFEEVETYTSRFLNEKFLGALVNPKTDPNFKHKFGKDSLRMVSGMLKSVIENPAEKDKAHQALKRIYETFGITRMIPGMRKLSTGGIDFVDGSTWFDNLVVVSQVQPD